ncbi:MULTISPECIES: pyridoxal phosphate-dependent aminotransferase [Hydrocarboniphaga]|uniref:Aminotransferase, class I and II n=1 Tax=Hydrocarboniphaga effusa AP103 TaxID=1172194 RepID=I7Z9F3_9GAMM|nr:MULTISPECIES: pyridoxal phosphate-dependent aminotransferase [Hydrocarboniphaga]EIT68312.1 aminotransferase, class I and II [Hydrocarboniphaga effusa AP103]MDZ4078704.1 pyridoxal phosphate-dependent aminotransferase [Hydrocarboniphaga sp.]
MELSLAQRVGRIKPSPTLAVTAKANELKAAGKDVLSLGAGEPDFDTPEHIKEAARGAIAKGFTKYTAVGGTPSLKAAIIAKMKRDNGLDYKPNQVVVSVGGKQACYNLCQALLNATDEVIVPAPYWVSYPDMVLLADATPVFINTTQETRFKITPEQLERAISPRTKMIWLNSPSNPSGMAYSKAELQALGEVLRKHPQIVIASDDMYEKILWTGEPYANIVNACPDLYDRTVIIHAVSKTYSMTGWRIGWACGPAKLIGAMADIQSQSTSNPTSIAQVAAEAALNGDQGCVTEMVKAFKQRHDHLVADLNTIPGVSCAAGDGTFYVFPNVEGLIARLGVKDDLELSDLLLQKALVALVPGSAFGTPGHVRLSFATSDKVLKGSVERIRALV